MRIICVDDEELILRMTVELCRECIGPDGDVRGFTRATEALDWVGENRTDAALLDIDMPDMNGLVLAARIKECSPDTSIIFLTGYSQYAVEAFSLHVSGYLLKPVNRQRLTEELEYARESRSRGRGADKPAPLAASTFGNFDLLVKGKPVAFQRAKAKELLAYLVDRSGSNITRPEAAAILWEDAAYDRSMQKQLDVIIRSLRSTLEEYGVGDLLEIRRGYLRIRPELLECDLYRFMNGDIEAVNSYRGEYMIAYSWAEITAAYMERLQHMKGK